MIIIFFFLHIHQDHLLNAFNSLFMEINPTLYLQFRSEIEYFFYLLLF